MDEQSTEPPTGRIWQLFSMTKTYYLRGNISVSRGYYYGKKVFWKISLGVYFATLLRTKRMDKEAIKMAQEVFYE
jgi:hypothetical protein